ncbi:S41 family peptidase [Pontibacter cellulosilyticus]|uniref:Tail specific protease domain-containing protein n=1 Tax=Pontibacter cellulosilyticus TaxID=1720253 RepID=A0A923SJT4_9BACT|nr:S41 family peptidase [Pontibacter cellulosilyticus]MBC5993086.1 hypothetical protein [Pontibacter cellulosilyticus]
MKLPKTCFLLVLACFILNYTNAAPKPLGKKTIERVATFTKVWGLMKYYHPEVAAGSINWDSVFVALTPKVAEAQNQQEFDALMEDLYTSVPAPTLADSYNIPKADTTKTVFAVSEIADYKVSVVLKQQLRNLYERHLPLQSRYITNKYKEYTLDYIRFIEDPLDKVTYPESEIRLLALARYWNTINYFYPHKYSIGKAWERVLLQYIPVFANAPNELDYHLAIQRLNKELVDTHSFVSSPIINAMWGPNPHFMVGYMDGKYVITSLKSDSIAKAEDVRVGDILVSINGKPIKQRMKELWPLMVGSNRAATHRDVAIYLLNIDAKASATIDLKRNGSRLTRTISRYPYQELVKLSDKPKQQNLWREVAENVYWVNFGAIQDTAKLRSLFEDLKKAETVIMDLRRYPNYQVYMMALPALLSGSFQTSTVINAQVNFPGLFTESKSIFERTDTSKLAAYSGRMIVLVNEHTQSLGESFAFTLALRPNTTILGSQTAGTTGNITWLSLPGGARIAFTGVGEHGVDYSFEQRKGVKIDKVVKPTIDSIAAGKDAVLDAAVEEARKLSVTTKR